MGNRLTIIGGGISGLVSGIYGLKNGFDATIYEKNDYVGGLLLKTKKKTNIKSNYPYFAYDEKLFEEIGLTDLNIINQDYYIAYKNLYLYRDLDGLESELIEYSSVDEKLIKKFVKMLREAKEFDYSLYEPIDIMNTFKKAGTEFKAMKARMFMNKYANITIEEFLNGFINKDIKNLFMLIYPSYFPLYALIFKIVFFLKGKMARLDDTSFDIVEKVKNYYLSLGGKIEYNREAVKIDFYRGKAQGVWFTNKYYINTDYVICALDNHYVYHKLLEGKYKERIYEMRYEDYKTYPLITCITFNFEMKDKCEDLPYWFALDIPKTQFASSVIDKIQIINHNNSYLTCLIFMNDDDYKYYEILNKDKILLDKNLKDLENNLIDLISKSINNTYGINTRYYPFDIYSPIFYNDAYSCYHGSFLAFGLTKTGRMMEHNGKLNGINNLMIAGNWLTNPGGILTTMINGKNAVTRLMYYNKKAPEENKKAD